MFIRDRSLGACREHAEDSRDLLSLLYISKILGNRTRVKENGCTYGVVNLGVISFLLYLCYRSQRAVGQSLEYVNFLWNSLV